MSVIPEIQKKANKLLTETGIASVTPVPIEKIAEHLGYTCESFIPNSATLDVAGAVDHLNKKIKFNQYDPEKRRRFVVAYEIGHIVLQGGQNDYADYWHLKISDPKENELDYFAECVLMPEKNFRAQWELLHHDVNKLSELFNVSPIAVEARISTLALTV